jgi:glutathione S-transferase
MSTSANDPAGLVGSLLRKMSGQAGAGQTGGGQPGGSYKGASSAFTDRAPSWAVLHSTWSEQATEEERQFRTLLASGRLPHAHASASKRLFDLPDGQEPRCVLYRDTASWCPYSEKVWLVIEEMRVPYTVEKVNMNCYGDKPKWFWAMQPSGGIPVLKLDGRVIKESNDIVWALEEAFPDRALLPHADAAKMARVMPLLSLEREAFSAWFRWLPSASNHGANMVNMQAVLRRVDEELKLGGGPFFLGAEFSLVDAFFAPFLERMAASLPYYKGLRLRDSEYARIEAWFVAMEARPSYRHIQSDYYTHVHDLPPQIGGCQFGGEHARFSEAIDGADGVSWTLGGLADEASTLGRLQPSMGLEYTAEAARREAAERLTHNHANVARFAARGLGRPGVPPVSAALSDPRATHDEASLPQVDAALRHVVHALLEGPAAAEASLSQGLDPRAAAASLGYLRDRVSVPRDMSYPAARQLRAHLNWGIEAVGAASAG